MPDNGPGASHDLWGAEFTASHVEAAPLALLKEQADALTRRTGGLIVGEVKEEIQGGTVWTSLYARVPALRDYRHKLISVAYPVIPADPVHPFPLNIVDTQGGTAEEVADMETFVTRLGNILSSGEVHAAINNLMRYGGDRAAS